MNIRRWYLGMKLRGLQREFAYHQREAQRVAGIIQWVRFELDRDAYSEADDAPAR